jgi:cation diffusion facilitator family transporter
MAEDSPTRRTVLIAGAANLFVGVIKLAAGILVGSSAMLAEAAHSAADTLNQAFLLASLHQGERPADSRHPFGYGQERYFWSLLAAFGIFIAGAGFSIFEGLLALTREHSESPLIAYLALAAAGVAEGTSLVRVLIQYRGEARRSRTEIIDQVRASPDLTVRTALFEDSAAIVGLVLAALGLALRQVTGSPVWDGAASMAIGVLLIAVAVKLGMDSRDYLIGRAAGARELDTIRGEIEQTPGVDKLFDLSTMYLGPEHLIVAAKVAFSDEISADRAEDIADEIDKRLSDRLPVVPHVFLDPTQAAPSAQLSADRGAGVLAPALVSTRCCCSPRGGSASAGEDIGEMPIGEMQWLSVRALGLSVRERSRGGGEAAQHMCLPGPGQGEVHKRVISRRRLYQAREQRRLWPGERGRLPGGQLAPVGPSFQYPRRHRPGLEALHAPER